MADEILITYKADVDGFVAKTKQATDSILGVGKASEKAADDTKKAFEGTGETLKELKDKLKSLREEFNNTKEGTVRYKELKSQLVDTNFQIGEITKNLSITGKQTDFLARSIGRVAEGIAGGFAVARGAVLLFGKDAAAVEKAHKEVEGAIALVIGLRSVQEGFLNAQKLISVARTEALNALGLTNIAVTSAEAVATGEATIAQRLFNAAVTANPLFILIGAILLAVSAFVAFSGGTEKSAEELKKETEETEKNAKAKRDLQLALEDSQNARLKALGITTDEEIKKQKLRDDFDEKSIEIRKGRIEALAKLRKEKEEAIPEGTEGERRNLAKVEQFNKKRQDLLKSFDEEDTQRLTTLNNNIAAINEEIRKKADEKGKKTQEEKKARYADENALNRKQILEQIAIVEEGEKTAVNEENKRFNDRLKKAGLFNVDRYELAGDSLKALELLEIEHENKLLKIEEDKNKELKDFRKKAEDERLKDFQDALKKSISAEERRLTKEEEIRKKRIDDVKKITDVFLKAADDQLKINQDRIGKQISIEEKAIETQRGLAERGLANSLAIEEKRKAQLERSLIAEKEKERKLKLFETFLNSLAEYSKVDPKTAIFKALATVAAAETASAIFAEEGGIIGSTALERSNGRKHRGGGDVLLHAQTGEGILSRNQMDALGGARGFHNLVESLDHNVDWRLPSKALVLPMERNNSELLSEMKSFNNNIAKIPRFHTAIDGLGNIVEIAERAGKRTIKTFKKRTL